MKHIFFLITAFFLLNQTSISDAKDAEPILEEVISPTKNANQKLDSLEEITAELNAQKAAEEPFSDKDVKVDIESLGLDSVDDKKLIKDFPVKKAEDVELELPKIAIKEDLIKDKNATKDVSKNTPPNIEKKSALIEIGEKKDSTGGKIISKIRNFITGEEEEVKKLGLEIEGKIKEEESKIDAMANSFTKSLIEARREKLRQRILKEKKEAAEKKAQKRREIMEKRLAKLRAEYLIKLNDGNENPDLVDEDFETNSLLIRPKEKSFRWSDRFISHDPPALPILDRYRGNENKYIPIIPTAQERIDDMFRAVNSVNASYFNSAYQYVLDPNMHNPQGETILTFAALHLRHSIIASILAKGADPDLPNNLGHTAFNIAIEMFDMKTAQILIDMNADVNYTDGLGRTYLMHAARVGFLPMVDLLVSQGVDVNASDNGGITPLAIAYKYKKEVIVKFLLKAGAKPWIERPYTPGYHNLIKELESRWGNKNKPPEAEILPL